MYGRSAAGAPTAPAAALIAGDLEGGVLFLTRPRARARQVR